MSSELVTLTTPAVSGYLGFREVCAKLSWWKAGFNRSDMKGQPRLRYRRRAGGMGGGGLSEAVDNIRGIHGNAASPRCYTTTLFNFL